MASKNLSDSDWDTLLGRIRDGKCTPFLGAGANFDLLPGGTSIATEWADQFSFPLPQDRTDLSKVSQFIAIHKDDQMWPKEEILRLFKRKLGSLDLKAHLTINSSPQCVLANLPLPIFMTTNYDDFMTRALQFQGKQPQIELCRWNEFLQRKHKSLFEGRNRVQVSVESPVVFHLHGHQDCPESLVLTEDDYLDFLISMSKDQDLLPARIQEALTYSSLLFIGYRLADLNFRVLFRSLFRGMEDTLRRINLAIQLPHRDGPKAQEYLDRYFSKVKVRVYWGDAQQFVEELRDRWRSYAK
jgi:hypothetical protein